VTQVGPLPELDDTNRHFWTGGAEGELRFLRCQDCGHYLHPPKPRCPVCYGERIEPEAVSGDATVASFTINFQSWLPDMEVPFVVAIVEFPEQPSMRLTTNIIGCVPEDVRVGLPVHVVFEEHEDVWIPFFQPLETK
jgi:uncharacterized OB-fold protein